MKKIKKTYLDFTAYIWRDHKELDPSYLQQCREFLDQLPATSRKQQASGDKQQAVGDKPQATSRETSRK